MRIAAIILAVVLGLPLAGGAAMAAETGNPSLVEAVKQGDHAVVQSLLAAQANVNAAELDGTTALMWAATRNDLDMADLLLRAGADVKAANQYGATALYAAAASPDAAMTERLLAAGADPNAHLLSGETPLMEASRRGNLPIVAALLAAGADPNAQEANGGQNALMWAISERHAAVAQALVQQEADINARSKGGFTALMFAAQQGDADSARILLDAGAKPNDVLPKSGLTPLLIASAMGRAKVAALLLDKGADPSVVATNGFTSLHYAARRRGPAAATIITALLAHGAKPNVRLKQPKPTAMSPNGIVFQGATALAFAADVNNIDAVKALVAGGADPLIPTEQNTSPLMLAAGAGTDVVRSRSPAERAVAIETVKFLVEHGADVNAAGQFGWTALHSATYQGLNDVIEYLVSKGAKLDAKDGFGQTPLSISNTIITKEISSHGYQAPRIFRRETANLLLRLGATPLDQSGVVGIVQRVGTE
jgi:ankyrin repeat protein